MSKLTAAAQTTRLSKQFITTPQIENTLSRVDEVIYDTKYSGKAKGLLICGPSGAGKSTMIKKLISDRRQLAVDGHKFTTIYMELPSKPTLKSMGETFLEGLGDAFAKTRSHSAEFKLLRIIGLLKDLGTELVIFDEVQHIVDRLRNTNEASNWIKHLMNNTGVAVVLIGMRSTQEILNNDQQLRRRFSATIDFDRFKISKKCSTDFLTLLKTLEGVLGVQSISLTTGEMIQRFYYASYGLIDYLVKIIDRAVYISIKNNLEGITLEVFSQAFKDEVWSNVSDDRNPFSPLFNFRALIEHNEPFNGVDNNQQ